MIYILSFTMALSFTLLVQTFALSNGFVDKANGDPLKIHEDPVALLGGVAVWSTMALSISVYYISQGMFSKEVLAILIGGGLIFGLGLIDDIKGIKPSIRLFVEVLAGVVLVSAGVRPDLITVWWIAAPVTIFYIVGAINAFNVIDGMDGLCAGVSLISCVGFFFLGLGSGNMFLSALSAILFMSLLGFLPYNFYPARIFLGDAGSGFLGFMMGAMAVMATSGSYSPVRVIAPILIIAVPVSDMAFAILRRLTRRRPLFSGDRDHLYDLMLKKGWSQPKVWCVMCALQTIFVVTGLAI